MSFLARTREMRWFWLTFSSSAVYKGTINDPTPFPTPSKAHGSHHWAFERLLSAALIPMTGVAFVTGGSHYPILDGVLALSLVVHSHIGVRKSVVFNLFALLILLQV